MHMSDYLFLHSYCLIVFRTRYKLMEELILDVITEKWKKGRLLEVSIPKRKSCLTNLVAFCDVMAGSARGQQWTLSAFISASLLTLSPITSSSVRQASVGQMSGQRRGLRTDELREL